MFLSSMDWEKLKKKLNALEMFWSHFSQIKEGWITALGPGSQINKITNNKK